MSKPGLVTIRVAQKQEQQLHSSIRRIIGLLPAQFMAGIIDSLDLDANPRNSRLGSVTDAIIHSIEQDELSQDKLFPFKTKGILLAASRYEELERNRFALQFVDINTEGILDGGHNTLAVGTYILLQAMKAAGKTPPKKSGRMIWEDFKKTWEECRADIEAYLEMRRDKTTCDKLASNGVGTLDFEIPIELLLPVDQSNELCLESFHTSLLEICDARNNNVQLTQGTKADKEGIFDAFKDRFKKKDPELAAEISWKTNDGNRIESRTLVALAWIPLSLTHWVKGSDKIFDAPTASSIYSGKQKCLDKFLDLMRCEQITSEEKDGRRELKDDIVGSALSVAVDLPYLFDKLYEMFPDCYNTIGSFGRISAVKGLMNKRNEYETPFLRSPVKRPVPDAFIYPLIFGLRALMRINSTTGRVEWKMDPYVFTDSEQCREAIIQYCGVIQQSDYDPQKVGKGAFSYVSAENAMKLAYGDYLESEA
ncbi:hypothetical protein [[Collinsella] massiliensis]|uniref:Abortive phage infection protein n=1 Tax=[Collinsella] massiliensis TaxID=1232426 RepID=A0A1Y3XYH9_9ACTN|nr:hypothetical protein [[Collinsella] massiliensis]OUN89358.1 hypothetical protein B5G02_02455 [[Collinsella] massiliensis]